MRQEESPTVIALRDIPPEGLRRELDLSGDFARMALDGTEADIPGARLSADLHLERHDRDVLVQGDLRGAVTLVCSRCLAPAKATVDGKIVVLYVPHGGDEAPDHADNEDEADRDSPDVITYQDDTIDL